MAERSFDQISFSAEPRGERLRDTPQAFAVPVTLPARGDAQVIVPAIRRRLRLKVVDWPGGALDTTSSEEALDAERLRPPVLFRNWHPGDVFCPRGRRRARKLKELLREACVASGDRRLWPVLQSGAGLVWVRGLPPAAACIPGPDTKAALLISEEEL
jgi:tRNA(Ile)-lysidine synthetase-like protein